MITSCACVCPKNAKLQSNAVEIFFDMEAALLSKLAAEGKP